MMRKCDCYDVQFKLKVIQYAKEHSNCAAERYFGVTEKMVRDWRAKEEKLNKSDKTIKKMRTVLSPYEDLECKLKDWVHDL